MLTIETLSILLFFLLSLDRSHPRQLAERNRYAAMNAQKAAEEQAAREAAAEAAAVAARLADVRASFVDR